jgi:uncharacterized protein (DUF427 family)
MSLAEVRAQVTLAHDTIHNPDEPRHFMRIKPVKTRVRVLLDGRVLAESQRALRVLEAGRDLYDPVLYFPASDVRAKLSPVDKRTFCPLKGHASYFDLVSDDGRVDVPEIAWSYRETFDFAAALKDLVAFDAARVAIEEHPVATIASS